MIQRRQFFGAATAAAFCLSARPMLGFNSNTVLSWQSKVIQTVRRGKSKRKPVVTGVSLQQAGNLLAIVGDDHYVSLYDTKAEQFVHHIRQHSDWVRSAKFSPDSSALFTCGNDHQLIRWESSNLSRPTFNVRQGDAIIELAISHDSMSVATVGFNRDLIVYDAATGDRLSTLKCSCDDNHAVAFSPDDKLVAAGGRCGGIRVWETRTNRMVNEIKAHRRRVRSLEFMDNGNLISASDDQLVKVHDLADPAQTVVLPRHASKLFSVRKVSPSVLATAGSDNKIHVWNTIRQSEIGVLDQHTGTVSCLDMAQDVLVSGSFDTTVRIWTPNQNELVISEPKFETPRFENATADQTSAQPNPFTTRR